MGGKGRVLDIAHGSSKPRVFLSAGEASGDAYGAALIRALEQRLPGASFVGLGGAQMEAAGQQRTVYAEDVAVMGVTEILLHIPKIVRSYLRLVGSIRQRRPDVAVLIDFPDVNFRLAKHLRRAGVPVIWFVSPQLWAWKRRRLRWVQSRVDRMLVIFPFEERFYRERGVDATFVGHPLADLPPVTTTREQYAAMFGLDPSRTWIALLPGSRWAELRAHLPALHELAVSDLIAAASAATTFDRHGVQAPRNPVSGARYEFLLPVASTISQTKLRSYLAELNREHVKYFGPEADTLRLTVVPDAREALQQARASVVASGTATVLAALAGNPFVVVYRVSALTFALARRLVRYPEEFPSLPDGDGREPVSMVNLVAGRRVVPELLQKGFTAANVASELAPLLRDGPERTAQIHALAEVRGKLVISEKVSEGASAIERVAETVAEFAAKAGRMEREPKSAPAGTASN